MAKPAATFSGWASGGSIVTPGAGKIAAGWVTAERPPAQFWNALQRNTADWLDYLNALMTTGGGVTDPIDTSGAAHFGGATTLGSTLGVTGLITATAGLTAAANQHVTVSGTGVFKHGTKTLSLPMQAQTIAGSPGPTGQNNLVAFAGANTCMSAQIPLPVGARILAVRVRIQDSATGPTKAAIKLMSSVDSGAAVTIATSAQSAGSGAYQTLVLSGLTQVLASLTSYWVAIGTATGTNTITLNNLEVDYDQP